MSKGGTAAVREKTGPMLRRMYDKTMALAGHRHAERALGVVSFAESSFFPIPPDVILAPMVLAQRSKAWRFAAICTITSVFGALLGYLIGYGLFETIGQPILDFYGLNQDFAAAAERYNELGWVMVLLAGITPIPFKVITITSGVTGLNIVTFILASIVARGIRFYAVTAIIYWFGPKTLQIIEKRLGLFTALFCILLIGGFVVMRFVL